MENNDLIIERQTPGGECVRIWRYKDGRFLFDQIKSSGKEIMVFCSMFEEALDLWCRLEGLKNPSTTDIP